MADNYRRIKKVVIGGSPDEVGIWLDDGSRLVVGNMEVTARPGYAASGGYVTMRELTFRISSPDIEWEIR